MIHAAVVLSAPVLRTWVSQARERLEAHRATLDALNVFPVRDRDTGTNLSLTLAEAAAAIAALPAAASAARVSVAMARGALVGARGNSGVIVSQYLGALLRHGGGSTDRQAESGPAGALQAAATAAYAAVARPVEGTVLTIGREVAAGARAAAVAGAADPAGVVAAGVAAGYAALERTPEQLLALRRAGVVDAGALGLLLILDGLVAALGGRDEGEPAPTGQAGGWADRWTGPSDHAPHDGHDEESDEPVDGGQFEVMYLVRGTPDGPGYRSTPTDVRAELSAALSAAGGSVAVVGGDGLWQAHVHTDRPLDVLALVPPAATRAGQFRIRHLATQAGVHGIHRRALGLVAVTGAVGLVPDLARAGAVVVLVPPGQPAGPELGRAVDDTGAGLVLVLTAVALTPGLLPDGPTAGRTRLEVLTGLSQAQLVVGAATFTSLVPGVADLEALGQVRAAVRGVRSAVVPGPGTGAGPVGARDVGARREGGAVLVAALDLLADPTDLLTVLTGSATPSGRVRGVLDALRISHPSLDVVVLEGVLAGDIVVLGAE